MYSLDLDSSYILCLSHTDAIDACPELLLACLFNSLKSSVTVKVKVKVGFLYSTAYAITGPARFTISEMTADRQ